MHLMLPFGLKLACTAVLWHVCDLGLKAALERLCLMLSAGGKDGADQAHVGLLRSRLVVTPSSADAPLLGLPTA